MNRTFLTQPFLSLVSFFCTKNFVFSLGILLSFTKRKSDNLCWQGWTSATHSLNGSLCGVDLLNLMSRWARIKERYCQLQTNYNVIIDMNAYVVYNLCQSQKLYSQQFMQRCRYVLHHFFLVLKRFNIVIKKLAPNRFSDITCSVINQGLPCMALKGMHT